MRPKRVRLESPEGGKRLGPNSDWPFVVPELPGLVHGNFQIWLGEFGALLQVICPQYGQVCFTPVWFPHNLKFDRPQCVNKRWCAKTEWGAQEATSGEPAGEQGSRRGKVSPGKKPKAGGKNFL